MRFLPLLVLVSVSAFAQKTDSLLIALEKADHDTTKLSILDIILEGNSSDYGAVEKYSLQMKDLSEANAEKSSGKLKKTYLRYYATALNNLAFVEENKSNVPGAIESYEKALAIFRDIDDKPGIAMCLTNLGFVSKKTGDLAGAAAYYEKAMAINQEIDSKTGLFASYNNMGVTFFAMGEIKKALNNYFEALKVSEEMNDKRRQARALNNIAGVYLEQKEIKLHREYLEKALATAVEGGEKRGEASILVNLVSVLSNNERDKKWEYANRVVAIANELNDKLLLSNGYSLLGMLSRLEKDYATSLKYEKEALAIRSSLNQKIEILGSQNSIGETYMGSKNYNEAISYFKKSLEGGKAVGHIKSIGRAAKNLSEAYKIQGNSSKALEYYELHIKMRDSIANEENRKAMFKSQYKYEYEIKATADSILIAGEKAVLSAQLSQEKSQRYALIALIVLGITLAGFVFYRFRVKQQMKELQLRNRIASDLHDEVGSAISSISLFAGIAKMKSGDGNDEIMAKIENTSRETVDKMGDIVWSIEPSNDRFDNVLKKMNYFGDQLMSSLGINFNFAVENGVEKTTFDMSTRKNIYLIYKEAINNVAKYSGAKNVNVVLSKEGRSYEMEIADDGKGFDTKSSTMGNGLRNMKRRAEEMDGKLIINSTENGTVITLTV